MLDSVVITGGTEGIGRALADTLLTLGFGVWITGRYAPRDDIQVATGMLHKRPGDVRRPLEILGVFEEAAQSGRLVGLVNCAGVIHEPGVPFHDTDPLGMHIQIETNLTGAILATQCFLNLSRAPRRFIVMVASTSGMRPSPQWAAYGASKAGMINFGQSIAEAYPDLDVITVAPGRTATRLRAQIAPDEDASQIMQPQAVADVIASHISAALNLNGGPPASRYTGDPIVIRNPESA